MCDTCGREISPGDNYRASVSVSEDRKDHRICVYKEHLIPECPQEFWDEEDEKAKEAERFRREDEARAELERIAA